jgi:hypothetical protein
LTEPGAGNPLIPFLLRYGRKHAGEEGPVRFVREVLGVEPDAWQLELLRAYGRGERRLSVVSGHGVGKSAVLAWIAVHHQVTEHPQKTAATAPTANQLFDVFFAETKKWLGKCPDWLQALFEVKSDRIELRAAPAENFLTCRTSRAETPEALAGLHSDDGSVLLIGDESSGIPEQIFEAASGSMSGHNCTTLLAGNPVRVSGLFFETHHRLRSMWYTIQVSCEDSRRVSDDFVQDMEQRYGRESNAFRVRVLGQFPRADDDVVIPYDLMMAATQRDITVAPTVPTVWGLDVARRGGARTALAKRKGNLQLEKVQWWRDKDLMETAARVKMEWDLTPPSERPVAINVDVIGMGSGVVDRLRQFGLPVYGVNVGELPPIASEVYRNVRCELWFKVREWLMTRAVRLVPEDVELQEQLVVPKFKYLPSGKLWVENKDEVNRRTGRESPDLADAFILTFASDVSTMAFGSAGVGNWNTELRRDIKGVT